MDDLTELKELQNKAHAPSFWLGAHLSLLVVCIVLAPVTTWWNLFAAIPSALCLWANWESNFKARTALQALEKKE